MTAASPQQQVTQLLCDWRSGDGEALAKLIAFIQPAAASGARWLFATLSGENMDAT